MRRYHHIGIPTTEAKSGETHLKHLKLFVVSHEKSEFGVEWMRFEADAAVPDLVRQVPHVAFEVADLASELAGREILIPPNSPSDGVRVAFIVQNGGPIELEFPNPHPSRRQRLHKLGLKLDATEGQANRSLSNEWSGPPRINALRKSQVQLASRIIPGLCTDAEHALRQCGTACLFEAGRSVFGRFFYVVDHEDFDRRALGFQLQAELFLERDG